MTDLGAWETGREGGVAGGRRRRREDGRGPGRRSRPRPHGHRQHRGRPRAARARPSGPTTTRSRTRWPASTTRSAAGVSAAKPGPSWIGSRLSARRSGSASATGISPRTCGGPIDSGPVTVLRRWLELAAAMGIESRILLMTDDPVRTEVHTDDGWLEFQEYFVHRHQEPTVREVRFRGIESATATAEVIAAIAHAEVLVIAPSNPSSRSTRSSPSPDLPPLDEARARHVPMVAVSGIIGGKALKGPADRMLASLGEESSAPLGVARRYAHDQPLRGRPRRCRVGAVDPRARSRDAGDRHDHDRRRGPCATCGRGVAVRRAAGARR